MGLFNQFPFTNFDRVNLDALMAHVRSLDDKVDEYLAYATIKYADPLAWNITTQYEKNTVVVDSDGAAYLSTQPVPAGIAINNADYWTPIGNFSELWSDLKASIAETDLGPVATTPSAIAAGGFFWLNNSLYRATIDLGAGSAIIVGSNAELWSVEDALDEIRTDTETAVQDLTDTVTADIQTIDNKVDSGLSDIKNSIAALDLGTSATATEAITSGQLFYMNDMLYKALTNISQGSAISASNAFQTTVEDQIGTAESEDVHLPIGTIMPIYQGDYITEEKPASVVFINGKFYVLDSTENATNVGTLRVFDPVANTALTDETKSLTIGHANSMTYDATRNKVWVAPSTVYDGGAHNAYLLYCYEPDFSSKVDVTTPSSPHSVAYDHVTGQLYYMDQNDYVYLYDGTVFNLYSHIDTSGVPGALPSASVQAYNQDVAIYGGRFYYSSPAGNVISGMLRQNNSPIDSSFNISKEDYTGRWRLGELEGWDFDANGHLWAVTTVWVATNTHRNGFIVEIPVNQAAPFTDPFIRFTDADFSFEISTGVSTLFALSYSQIRSLAQLNNMARWNPKQVSIVSDYVDPVPVPIITRDIEIHLSAGTFTLQQLNVRTNLLTLNFEGGTLAFTGTASTLIYAQRGGLITIQGTAANISTPNRSANSVLINAGTTGGALVAVQTVPVNVQGHNLGINSGSLVLTTGLYMAGTKI